MTDPSPTRSHYDVVVVGGGHNGLVAAAYLARAGRSVLVVERLDHTGGAAVSAPAFPGVPTRLSRYSYLVSLMPTRLITELGLDLSLVSRDTASYSPESRDGRDTGLLVESVEGEATRRSFTDLLGAERGRAEHEAWQRFYADVAGLAAVVAPTLMEPLPAEQAVRDQVDAAVWRDLVQRPLGETIEARFSDDLVRGVVGTDALIGTFASMHDPSLAQNRCFLYHLIGNGTGEWRVPVGGMGAVTDALARAAAQAGAEVLTGAGVSAIRTGPAGEAGGGAEVTWHDGTRERTVGATRVLANVSPWVLSILRGAPEEPGLKPEGSQLKINLLLDRLPRLRSGVDPAVAFAGTLHLGESWSALQAAYDDAAAGRLPARLPGEVYCHSLSDGSILGDVPAGTHTLTYFGLHTPARLFEGDDGSRKQLAVERAIASLDEHLAEPLMGCVARDAHGDPCLEAKVPQDVERDLAMPGGHIFHGDLDWPWAPGRALLDTPARRWGVQTDHEAVMVCGSGSRRGGAVSGLGGHSAAMAALEELDGAPAR
ncbi:hypothetical protein ENKNEFLB_03450 [Nocardioides aquaticus]|uniref:Pyridine nucleotide-disulfide oxidoreductase domain-containing protein 2 n=1 Tax=Nocardioides aquaticus TaxID=160826 RepID=A0ABX8EKH8_9ACTN|nr:NAD(P)/FAD-dependent oxidoreductase [Nocardioides aquaticus]QVT81045.1 hypothetical protein ENKNEFLB_03450 [Nocardioides aquaticus]